MTPRNHPGVEATRTPIRFVVPITYFGSAWATIGLACSITPAADSVGGQQRAFDDIKAFHGKFETDDKAPGRPVVRVDFRYYELSDQEVAQVVKSLGAFPALIGLQFKSSKLTDAGVSNFKRLPQLRALTLENAVLTDAGLAHLKSLTYLEELNLKGTRVTDAGLQEFRKALPKVKVER